MRHRNLWLINIDLNPKITTLGLKKCLSMLLEIEHYRPTLDNLLLSQESLLNEENRRIIEKINSIRSNRYSDVPLLRVSNGVHRCVETHSEGKYIHWSANNATKSWRQLLAMKSNSMKSNSRSAHY